MVDFVSVALTLHEVKVIRDALAAYTPSRPAEQNAARRIEDGLDKAEAAAIHREQHPLPPRPPRQRRTYPRCGSCGHSIRSTNDLGYCTVTNCGCIYFDDASPR